jgi:hypothetical protein
MNRLRAGLLALLVLGTAWGCGTQTSPGDIITGKVFPEMAVGTLNDSAGTISSLNGGPGAGTYANVVTSFRNNLGASAFQNPGNGFLHFPGAPALAVGGLFSYGQAPGVNGIQGMLPAYSPKQQAVGIPGYATGFLFTGQPPTPGTYSWSTVAIVNGQNQPYGASATMPSSPTILGADAGGSYVADVNGDGGGVFTFAAPPAGVVESVVYIYQCPTGAPPPPPCTGTNVIPVASAEVKMGTSTATLPPGTLTSGVVYNAVVIGADYPFVEAGPPSNASSTPTLAGAGGTADLTASALLSITG